MPFPDFTPTVPELVRHAADGFGDHTYLVADGERLTYGEADARSAALAAGLLAEGIGKGSRVGVLIPNTVDTAVVAALASARIGAVLVPINTFLQTRELGWTIRHADLTVLVTAPRFLNNDYLERLEEALPGLADPACRPPLFLPDAPFLRAIHVWGSPNRSWSRGDEADVVAAGERAGIDDAFLARRGVRRTRRPRALIVYSSGSTADPKGAIHSQGAVVRHSCNVLVGLPDRARRRDVLVDAGLLDRRPRSPALPGAARRARRSSPRARSTRAPRSTSSSRSGPPSSPAGRSRARRWREHPSYAAERVAHGRAHEHGRPRAARAPTAGGQLHLARHDRDVQRAHSRGTSTTRCPSRAAARSGRRCPGSRTRWSIPTRSTRCRSASTASSGPAATRSCRACTGASAKTCSSPTAGTAPATPGTSTPTAGSTSPAVSAR